MLDDARSLAFVCLAVSTHADAYILRLTHSCLGILLTLLV